MKTRKWLLNILLLGVVLTGCIPEMPIIEPTQIAMAESSVTPSLTNISSLPDWCVDLKQEIGLPAINEVRDSSIVYEAFAYDDNKQVINPVWEVSMSDGSERLFSEKFLNTKIDDSVYDVQGNGFSLVSPSQKFVAVWGHWFESKNADNTYSLIIRNKENGLDTEIFRSSLGERIDGNWSPNGNYFVFTWYKNIPEYYSVVYSVNSDGTGLKELTDHLTFETLDRPYWSPDGKKIAVPVWGKAGGMHIMVINFHSGIVNRFKVSPIIRLHPGTIFELKPQNTMAWSSDSQWFAYISEYGHIGIEILNTENGRIYCIQNDKIFGIEKLAWQYDNP